MRALSSAAVAAACIVLSTTVNAGDSSGPAADRAVPASPAMTAAQIVDKTVEARGGLDAWRKIETIIWVGHLESARSAVPSLPFRLEEKKPDKSRFEINEPSQRSLRVFDGMNGWKMRNGQDGRPDIKRFTPQEVRFAREASGLEGPLIDFRAKGSSVEVEGTEQLDGRKTYRIGVELASGERLKVWIDAETFLEARYDRTAYSPNGALGTVSIRYRDYKQVEGLALPSLLEISGAAGGKPDRMVIERVALNAKIDDREFAGLGDPRERALADPGMRPK
jgi:hypothetical protein